MSEKIPFDTYIPSPQQKNQLDILFKILDLAESGGIILYLTGGYGLDALYGKLTRDHRDIDLYISRNQKDVFEEFLSELGFTASGETVGVVGKKEFAHKDFPESFTVEYGLLENAQKLMSGDDDVKNGLPTEPIGHLEGRSILIPSLSAFKKAIEINNSPVAKHTESYRHREWLDVIMPRLEAKYKA